MARRAGGTWRVGCKTFWGEQGADEVTGRVSFSGHETFPFRYPWLKKAVDAAEADPYAFEAEDAMVKLGVGKNMVSSIRHWGLTTGMLEDATRPRGSRRRPLAPSDLGRSLLADGGWDPFLEDPGTLWLLHWQLVSRPERATTWWWVFNRYPGTIFTRADVQEALETLGAQSGWMRFTSASLKRDIGRVHPHVRAVAAPQRPARRHARLSARRAGRHPPDAAATGAHACAERPRVAARRSLRLRVGGVTFSVSRRGRRPSRSRSSRSATPRRDARSAWTSPGCSAGSTAIEALTDGGVVFDETAGLKQIYVHSAPEPTALLRRYYDSWSVGNA